MNNTERSRAWKKANPEKLKAQRKAYQENNKEALAAKLLAYRQHRQDLDAKGYWLKQAWNKANTRAKAKGLPFEPHLVSMPDLCPALGIPLVYKAVGRKHNRKDSPSLDQIVPGLGYVPGNVQVISMAANRIKTDATWQEVQAVAYFMRPLRG